MSDRHVVTSSQSTADQRVIYLESQEDKLQQQIVGLQGFQANEPGYDANNLKKMLLFGFSDDQRSAPKVEETIAELKAEKTV